MNTEKSEVRPLLLVALAVLVLAFVAGCGGGGDDSTQSSGSTESSGGEATTEEVATAGPTIEELTTTESLEAEPPTSGPPPAKGKKVWWISCGQVVPDCSEPAAGAKESAAKLGYDFQIADGKLNVGGGNATALRTALAAGPDAVIIHGIACPVIEAPLREAKEQGVIVMGVEALDCSAPPTNGEELFSADMNYAPKIPDTTEYFKQWGAITAQYMLADLGDEAKIINAHGTDPLMEVINEGFMSVWEGCSSCEILEEVNFNSSDQVPNGPFSQRIRSAVVSNPTVEGINMVFDANLTVAGGERAVHEVNPEVKLYGGSGQTAGLDLIREGKLTAAPAAHSPEWMGYAAMDNMNRLLNEEETVPEGVGFRPVDKDHNLPPSGPYVSPIEWKQAYETSWGSGS